MESCEEKIFKYFSPHDCRRGHLATTLLPSWVNYEMLKGRVMDDLEAGRMFAVAERRDGGTEARCIAWKRYRVTLDACGRTVYYDNFVDPNAMDNTQTDRNPAGS